MELTRKKLLPPALSCFSELKDPRVAGRCHHICEEIIVITLCGILSGARHWSQIERYGQIHIKWFKKFLQLPNGVPSHDTIGRFWGAVHPENFLKCFKSWIGQVSKRSGQKIIAIDGKSSRATGNRCQGLRPAHIVNAFDVCTNLTLSQVRVPDKTNEIKAIPELLKILEVSGCIVTIDAMGCQRGIAKLLKNKGSDYVLAVKMNQGKLYKSLNKLFERAEELEYNAMVFRQNETNDYGHGRIEQRHYTVLPQCYKHQLTKQWPGLQSLIQVKRTRIVGDETSMTTHYFISSLEMKRHKTIAKAIRAHWRIENNCHWLLDNTFLEDRCTARVGYASENFSLLRKFVLNLLKIKRRGKLSFESMRLEAAWNRRFLERLLN